MSQIIIKRGAGEVIRTIAVPPGGITVRDLAQHLREQRNGVRLRPFDVVTIEASSGANEQPAEKAGFGQRSCGS